MKFHETSFSEYTISVEKFNLHNELQNILKYLPDNIMSLKNLIFFGPPGTGKYSQALFAIKKYSLSNLKYERKISINTDKKREYSFKASDIHFEIDMDLLGCNARILWNEIYYHILDIISARPSHSGIIICKNFHCIHSELLDVFYSYMENLNHMSVRLRYILITEQLSFIPYKIIKSSKVIPVIRPSKTKYNLILDNKKLKIKKKEDLKLINNIKDCKCGIYQLINSHEIFCTRIIKQLNNYQDIDFLALRDNLYSLFIYHLDINKCILHIIQYFIVNNKLNKANIILVLEKLFPFLKYYNNNYRPIYHLESFILTLCKTVHGL